MLCGAVTLRRGLAIKTSEYGRLTETDQWCWPQQYPSVWGGKGNYEFANYTPKLTAPPLNTQWVNSLGPGDAKWRQSYGSTSAQLMACSLTAPSHYLNQCWLIISEVQVTFIIRAISQEMPQPSITKIHLKIAYLNFHSNFPGVNELITNDNTKGSGQAFRPKQNGRHITDNIFKCIFLYEIFCILIQISLKYV